SRIAKPELAQHARQVRRMDAERPRRLGLAAAALAKRAAQDLHLERAQRLSVAPLRARRRLAKARREVARLDAARVLERRVEPLHLVLELADVAREVVSPKPLEHL